MKERERERTLEENDSEKKQNENVNERYLSHTFVNSKKKSENERANERAVQNEKTCCMNAYAYFLFPAANQSGLSILKYVSVTL